jgi:hypothetical protein
MGRDLLEDADRNQSAVHRRAALARGLDLSPDEDLLALERQTVRLQDGPGARVLEDAFDDRRRLAGPNEIAGGSRAEQQAQRIHQDRLARSGFSCQQRQAGPELDLEPRNQSDVLYYQQLEHVSTCPAQDNTASDGL